MKKCDDQEKILGTKEHILKYSMRNTIFRKNIDYLFPKDQETKIDNGN